MLSTTNQINNLAVLDNQQCEFTSDQEIVGDWLLSKAESTRKTYFSAIKQLIGYLGPITNWTKRGIQSWIESMKQCDQLKVATINKKLAAVRSLLTHCVAEGYLGYSVASNIKKIKQDKEDKANQSQSHTERIIGSDEVWKLIAAGNTLRDRLALKTCYLLGLRAHELSNLHWSDFSRDGNRYKVRIIGKNHKEAYLPVDNELIHELRQLGTSGYIFQSRLGNKISRTQLHYIVKKAASNAALDGKISLHWLRHQRCSDLVNSGKFTLSQVQRFMRHSSPTITDSYIHLEDEISSNELT